MGLSRPRRAARSARRRSTPAATVSGNCDAPGTALRAGTLQVNTPGEHDAHPRRARPPRRRARLSRQGGRATSSALDDASVLDGKADWAASGSGVTLSGGTIDVRSIALTVDDAIAPLAAIGGISNPASGTLTARRERRRRGTRPGAHDRRDRRHGRRQPRTSGCARSSRRRTRRSTARSAPTARRSASRRSPVNTTGYPDGKHILRVAIIDAAGNQAALPEFELSFSQRPADGAADRDDRVGNGTPTPRPLPRRPRRRSPPESVARADADATPTPLITPPAVHAARLPRDPVEAEGRPRARSRSPRAAR